MIPATTMGAMDLQDMEQPATGQLATEQLATELAAMELGMDLVLITIQVSVRLMDLDTITIGQ